MRRWIAPLLWLASVTASNAAYAYTDTTPILLCNSCQTQQQFNSNAAVSIGTTYGTFEFLSINPISAVIYDVTVEATSEEGHRRVLSYSTLAGPDVVQAFEFWWPYFSKGSAKDLAETSVTAPPGGALGEDGFGASEQGLICAAFTATPDYVKMHKEMNEGGLFPMFYHALVQRLGYGPTGVFIFANGDVATYYIYPDNAGATACAYVKGSARNAAGQFINDRGLGGNGASNGSNYVQGGNGNFSVLTQSYTLACTYVEDEEGRLVLGHCEIRLP